MDKQILIDRYILEEIVGEGSYSIVFRGWDQEDKKRVAIKELKSLGMTKEEADEAHRLFFNEINILKDLRHSGIPRVFDFFIFEGRHYMVMEWVEGENLEEMLERKGRISQDEALEYMKKLTNVLCYLQGTLKRVIYRDIKPSNIIVNENGSLKLIDFGISRYYSPEKKKDTHILGTPGYAPPEAYSARYTDRLFRRHLFPGSNFLPPDHRGRPGAIPLQFSKSTEIRPTNDGGFCQPSYGLPEEEGGED